jgi:hypothetical protein
MSRERVLHEEAETLAGNDGVKERPRDSRRRWLAMIPLTVVIATRIQTSRYLATPLRLCLPLSSEQGGRRPRGETPHMVFNLRLKILASTAAIAAFAIVIMLPHAHPRRRTGAVVLTYFRRSASNSPVYQVRSAFGSCASWVVIARPLLRAGCPAWES